MVIGSGQFGCVSRGWQTNLIQGKECCRRKQSANEGVEIVLQLQKRSTVGKGRIAGKTKNASSIIYPNHSGPYSVLMPYITPVDCSELPKEAPGDEQPSERDENLSFPGVGWAVTSAG